MVELKRIKTPSDIPAEGSYVLVLYVIDEADAKRTIGQPKPR